MKHMRTIPHCFSNTLCSLNHCQLSSINKTFFSSPHCTQRSLRTSPMAGAGRRSSTEATKRSTRRQNQIQLAVELECRSSRGSLKSFIFPGKRHEEKHSKAELNPPAPAPCKRRASISGCTDINNVIFASFSAHSPAAASSSSFSSSSSSSPPPGCQEYQMAADRSNETPRYFPAGATDFSCPHCEENVIKAETLELHQATMHAVSELDPHDISRKIVEIIFQSSWLKKRPPPLCRIILKIHNTPRTISTFENYRKLIKTKASKLAKNHPRSTADGNELLRFHCTTFTCSLGVNGGTTALCAATPRCNLCSIIREGFKDDKLGRMTTMATSGRAHDAAQITSEGEKIAMLVCRVIAGRVRRNHQDSMEEFDSSAGACSNLDELFVFNPEAILPCFVVIYGGC